jgi:hypothetical protein
MAETRSTHLSKRIWNISKYVLAILLVWFVFSKTSLTDIVDLFKRISLPWLGLSFVLFFLMTMMKALQYHLLSGRQTPYARLLSSVVIQNAITNFIATGAGIASYLTMFTVDEGVGLRRAAATFMIAKIGDLIVVWSLLLISSIFVWGQIFSLGIETLVILTVIPLSIGAFAALVICAINSFPQYARRHISCIWSVFHLRSAALTYYNSLPSRMAA